MIADFLGWIGSFFESLIKSALGFLSNLFGYLFNKLFDFLRFLLKPIFMLIGIIFYFLYKIGVLAVTLLELLLGIGKLFYSLVKGIFLTLAGFSFTPTTRDDGQWTSVFSNVVGGLQSFQIDTIAYILVFLVWFGFGFAAIKILSSIRGGK